MTNYGLCREAEVASILGYYTEQREHSKIGIGLKAAEAAENAERYQSLVIACIWPANYREARMLRNLVFLVQACSGQRLVSS